MERTLGGADNSSRSLIKRLISAVGPLLALLAVYLLFAGLEYAIAPAIRIESRRRVSHCGKPAEDFINSSVIGVCALGMTVVIISGGIDLSVGSGVALCATALACGLKANWNRGS